MNAQAPSADDLNRRLQRLIDFVREAMDRTIDGELVDLRDLDADVGSLCNAVEAAPDDIARQVAPKMAEMISGLEELARILKQMKENAPS